jgi:lipopolysaccharide biosynthesis regulator YciM
MSEAAEKNGQPCARCGMKSGAHYWPTLHPKACREWMTQYALERELEEDMGGWMFDPDMGAQG